MVWGVGEDKGDERIASGHSNDIGELTKLYCCQKKRKKDIGVFDMILEEPLLAK